MQDNKIIIKNQPMPIYETEMLQILAVDATEEENDILALELIDKKRALIEYQDEVKLMVWMAIAIHDSLGSEIDDINELLRRIN